MTSAQPQTAIQPDTPAPAAASSQPQRWQKPLSQLQRLDRSWTATIAACILLEVATIGMDNPLINGIRWVNRAGIVSVGSFKFCKYRLGEDIRSEIENQMRSQRVETAANAQKYRYEIENLKGTNNALSAEIQTLQIELERLQSVDQQGYGLKSTIASLQKQLDLKHSEMLSMQGALHDISRQNAVIKKHAIEFGLASRAVIVDLIQNSLLQKKQTVDQSAQLVDQAGVLEQFNEAYQQALEINKAALKNSEETVKKMERQQREYELKEHNFSLQILTLQTELGIKKKQNRFADDDD